MKVYQWNIHVKFGLYMTFRLIRSESCFESGTCKWGLHVFESFTLNAIHTYAISFEINCTVCCFVGIYLRHSRIFSDNASPQTQPWKITSKGTKSCYEMNL